MTSRTDIPDRTDELVTEWICDEAGFAALAAEWDSLHLGSAAATPFQRADWLAAWWQSYGTGALRVLTVRRNGRLVGGAALMVERRNGARVLSPVGRGLSDISEFIAAPSDREGGVDEVVRKFAGALVDLRGWDVFDIPEVRRGSVADRLAHAWEGGSWRTPSSVCLTLAGQPLDEVLPNLPKGTRHTIRRKLRIIDSVGVTVRTAAPHEAADAVATLLRLHDLQWRGRGGNPEHLTPRFRALLQHAVSKLAPVGAARVELHSLDGRVQAAQLLLVSGSFVGAYLSGAHPDLRARIDVATLFVRRSLAITAELGLPQLDLLRGDEDYKMRWRPERIVQERVLLSRAATPRAAAYIALARGRAMVRARLVEHPDLHAAVTKALRTGRQDGPLAALRGIRAELPTKSRGENEVS